jgi:diacylglycerol O-acyltransferase / wax synthase
VWPREIALGLAVFAVYCLVAFDSEGRRAQAVENGEALLRLEERAHLLIEAPLNAWLARHPTLAVLANYEYALVYVFVAFGVLFWIGLRRPQGYRSARTSFVLINLFGIGCFALLPVAPPRLLGDPRFTDTVLLGDTWGSWGSGLVSEANQLAAVPSLHVAWALWVCSALGRLRVRRSVQVLGMGHAALTVVVIVVTANHYWLDAVAGYLVAVLAYQVIDRFATNRSPA